MYKNINKTEEKSSRVHKFSFWWFGCWKRGNGDLPAVLLKREMRSCLGKIYNSTKRFFTGKITASHCKRGSDLKRRAALDPGGKRSGNSLAASTFIVGEKLGNAGCLLFGSDRVCLKGRHRDTVQLLSVMRRAGNIPSRWAKFHRCLLQNSVSHVQIAVGQCLFGESFQNHVWHYAHGSSAKWAPVAHVGNRKSLTASVRPGSLKPHQIPHPTSTAERWERVIGPLCN